MSFLYYIINDSVTLLKVTRNCRKTEQKDFQQTIKRLKINAPQNRNIIFKIKSKYNRNFGT